MMASQATSHVDEPPAEARRAVEAPHQGRDEPRPSAAAAAVVATTEPPVLEPVVPPTAAAQVDDKFPSMRETGSVTVVHLPAPPPVSASPPPEVDASEPAPNPTSTGGDLVLELLVLSGQRKRVRCQRDERISDLKQRVWKDWPQDWIDSLPRPDHPERLTLLFRGRVLADDKTLDNAGVKPFEGSHDPVVVHLHVKSLDPLPPDSDENRSGSSCSCCIIA